MAFIRRCKYRCIRSNADLDSQTVISLSGVHFGLDLWIYKSLHGGVDKFVGPPVHCIG